MEREKKPADREVTPVFGWRYYIWLLLFLVIILFWVGETRTQPTNEIPYSRFKEEIRAGNVASIVAKGEEISGVYRKADGQSTGRPSDETQSDPTDSGQFTTVLPPFGDAELMPLLETNDVTVQARPAEAAWWAQALVGLLPWLLIIGLIVYASRKMQQRMGGGVGDGVFGFGKSKAKRFREGSTNVTFNEVAGLDNAKKDLQEIVDYLRDPERYQIIGAKIPRGILLMGPPGTGKTLLAKAVAGEAHAPFYSISGSEFVEMFVGVGAARVRDMFESAKREAPAIIFIDEIDSVGRSRGTGLGGGHDEREQTLNQILSEMDGFEPHHTVVVLAATNRPDVLDPALLRPGRFDRKVTLDLPRREARERILEVHSRDVPLGSDVDFSVIARRTVGFSGADLENLVNEAALLAGREGQTRVGMAFFNKARDKILLGAEREGPLSEEDKQVVAYHEAGHALMAWLLPQADPLEKVTIIPRGRALGATEQLLEEERQSLKRSYLLDRVGVMLGGRVAERVIFGDMTSGAEADLKQATQLVRRMVCQWGMSDKLGPVTFRRGDEHIFLGREIAQPRDYSDHTARVIDDEIRNTIVGLEKKADDLLRHHRSRLKALADALIEFETVEGPEIERLFQEAPAG